MCMCTYVTQRQHQDAYIIYKCTLYIYIYIILSYICLAVVYSHIFKFHMYPSLQRKDILQLMIDASDSETQKGLETGEIIADSVGFMLAGYETTSTALTFATFLLAANTEAQERLANEIHEYFEENPVSDILVFFHANHVRQIQSRI